MERRNRRKLVAAMVFGLALAATAGVRAEDGSYQIIDGTRVLTKIDHARDVAIFSDACGTQTLSHADLAAGAKPTHIIPCPRHGNSSGSRHATRSPPPAGDPLPPAINTVRYGALAAGIETGLFSSRAGIGSALKYSNARAAQQAALASCRRNGISNCHVVSTFTGCGYITVSVNGSNPVAWGAGPTAQDAYNNCFSRVQSGNCQARTLGGCN